MALIAESPRDISPAIIYATVAVTSSSALLFELFQTRILSFIFWNHIVYLAISIALLGFGVSGTVVSWITRKPIANLARSITRLCACLSLSFILAVLAIAIVLPLCLRESSPESKLTFCYLVSIPPFIFAGSILALLFSYGRQPIVRAIVSVALVVPVGISLGIFFPTGLQLLRAQAPEFVPSAWGINGCASVYASVLGILIAMWDGFNFAIGFGMLMYAVAVITSRFITDRAAITDKARLASAEVVVRVRTAAARA